MIPVGRNLLALSRKEMMKLTSLLVLVLAALVRGQRPFFAGTKPIGYPVITTTEGLADRFGEVNATTQRLPIEANGDRDLVDRLSKLPIDNQPFWLINWQALEAHRENPQTYPQKPNPFLDPPQSTGNLGNSNLGNSASVNSGNTGNASAADAGTLHGNNSISGNLNSASTNTPILANRNSFIAGSTSKSVNGNAAVSNKAGNVGSAVLEDRFSGGIEPNRYFENQNIDTKGSGSSNYEPGNTVNVNY